MSQPDLDASADPAPASSTDRDHSGAVRPGSLLRRVRWGLIDQAISSLTNLVIVLTVARVAAPEAFGTFAMAYVVCVVLLWVSRSLATEPLVIRFSARPLSAQRVAARPAAGAALAVGMVSGIVMLAVGVAVGGMNGAILAALAVSFPGLLLQDAYRYVLFGQGRPRSAAANDGFWFATQLALIGILAGLGRATPATLTLVFGLAASAAAVVGVWQTGARPALRGATRWMIANRDVGVPLVLELLAVSGATPIALFTVGLIDDATVVGGIRAATLLFGPLTMVFMGLFVTGVPEGVRMTRDSPARLSRIVVALGIAMPLTTACWALAIALLPNSVGVDLLKSNWEQARSLLAPVGAQIAGNACTFAALIGLRSVGAIKRSLGARIWSVPVTLGGAALGAALGGGREAAMGLAIGCWVDAALAWASFRRAIRDEISRRSAEGRKTTSPGSFSAVDSDLPIGDRAVGSS